ncbi:MAG: TolC family protein [Vicinamibacterales bacterium]|nr:TolC family protein [Vicinamibacterales bacterium]
MMRRLFVQTVGAACVACLASAAFAQGGGATSSAAQLPLSGRSGQAGTATASQTALPGATAGVNTASPTVQVQGALTGSRSGAQAGARALSGALGFKDAVERGLAYNLGTVNVGQVVKQARSQQAIARSVLLPNIAGDLAATRQQLNLAASGFSSFGSPFPGFNFPSVVGPFNVVDLRARLTQSVVDVTSWNNFKAAREGARAAELTVDDSKDLVVLAVGGSYLQILAARARVASARVQLQTAEALHRQTSERKAVGLAAQVDVDRSQIQALTQQQRLTALGNDLAKQKITLARMIGLPPTDGYELADDIAFAPAPATAVDQAVRQAREHRADLQSAEAQVRAAERALAAARAERLPTVGLSGDYGTLGSTLANGRATFSVAGRVHVPLWDGGRTGAHVSQAEAVVAQRKAELEDLSSQVEADIRRAMLDLTAATSQVDLAERNIAVTREVLDLTRQRFEAGVADSLEVVQAQESVATAELDLINGVFAHNLSKLTLARATGQANELVGEFLKLP